MMVAMADPFVGDLNRRVLIRRRVDSPVGRFELSAEFPDNIKRWAKLVPVGTAIWAASVQADEKVTHRCIVRRVVGINDAYEVVSRGRVYAVRRCAELRGHLQFTVLDLEEIGDVEVLG